MPTKTSVEVDHELVRAAGLILGTTTPEATIDAALRDVVDARRRIEVIDLLGDEWRFDFVAAERAWGGED